jgi:hypothetical protein
MYSADNAITLGDNTMHHAQHARNTELNFRPYAGQRK